MEQTMDRGIVEYNPPLETNIYDWQMDHVDYSISNDHFVIWHIKCIINLKE